MSLRLACSSFTEQQRLNIEIGARGGGSEFQMSQYIL